MNRRTNALMMTVASLIVMLAATGEGQGPAPFASAANVEMIGEWNDPTNFSGAIILHGLILIGSDEVGYLQVGRDKAGKGARFEKSHEIELTPKVGGKDVEIDVEALAANDNTIYALGSHSITRKRIDRPKDAAASNKATRNRFFEASEPAPERAKLYRFELDPATGKATSPPKEISLRAMIDGQDVLKPFAAIAS